MNQSTFFKIEVYQPFLTKLVKKIQIGQWAPLLLQLNRIIARKHLF